MADRNACPNCGTRTMIRIAQRFEQCVMCRYLSTAAVDTEFPFNKAYDVRGSKMKPALDPLMQPWYTGEPTEVVRGGVNPELGAQIDATLYQQRINELVNQMRPPVATPPDHPAVFTFTWDGVPITEEEFNLRTQRQQMARGLVGNLLQPTQAEALPPDADMEVDDYNWRDDEAEDDGA